MVAIVCPNGVLRPTNNITHHIILFRWDEASFFPSPAFLGGEYIP